MSNLKPFRPGESGNLKGRPKGRSLSKQLKDALDTDGYMIVEGEEVDEKDLPMGNTVRVRVRVPNTRIIIDSILRRAAKGDMRAAEMIFERIEGRATQFIDIESGGEPVGGDGIDYTKLSDSALREIANARTKR